MNRSVNTKKPEGRVILAGGSGFLGRTIAPRFTDAGFEVLVLSRGPACVRGARTVKWDGRSPGEWCAELESAAAVVNLAGRSVNCRYNKRNRREIMDSRILSTRALGEAIAGCRTPPAVWINSSTATIYRHTHGAPHGEDGEIGADPEARDAFSIEVARAWEEEFAMANVPGTRRVAMRAAIVLGAEAGGVYTVLRRLVASGLGGRMGTGGQYVSWIHGEDYFRALLHLIHREDATGIYNLAAPEPLTNREMMADLRASSGVPVGLPATRWMLELGAFFLSGFDVPLPHLCTATEVDLFLVGARVVTA